MRRGRILSGLAAVSLLGGCAGPAPAGGLAASPARGAPAVARSTVTPCTTTWLVLATVSRCGSGGFTLGVAAE